MSVELANRLGDLEWLISVGEYPPRAAERCGWTVYGAEQAARRHGAKHIAKVLWPYVKEARAAA